MRAFRPLHVDVLVIQSEKEKKRDRDTLVCMCVCVCVWVFWTANDSEVMAVQTIQLPFSQPSDSHMEKAIRMRNAFFWRNFQLPEHFYVFLTARVLKGKEDWKSKKDLLFYCVPFKLFSIVKLAENINKNWPACWQNPWHWLNKLTQCSHCFFNCSCVL